MTEIQKKPLIEIINKKAKKDESAYRYNSVAEVINEFKYCLTEEEIKKLESKLHGQVIENDFESGFYVKLRWVDAANYSKYL